MRSVTTDVGATTLLTMGWIIGRPARLAGLLRAPDRIAGRDDVWITGRDRITDFWPRTYPPRGI